VKLFKTCINNYIQEGKGLCVHRNYEKNYEYLINWY